MRAKKGAMMAIQGTEESFIRESERCGKRVNRNLTCHYCRPAFCRLELPSSAVNCRVLLAYFLVSDFMNMINDRSHGGMVLPTRYS